MKKIINTSIFFLVWFFFAVAGSGHSQVRDDIHEFSSKVEYIFKLDLTVLKKINGDIEIIEIGRVSPFRRYSWFRAGDVIEEVNNQKASLFLLTTLNHDQIAWIKYRRRSVVQKKQIDLKVSVYGRPPYL